MFSRLLPVFVFLFAACALFAQPAPPLPAQEPSTQALLDQIQQLQKRLTDMEEHQRRTDAALAALLSSKDIIEKTEQSSPPAASVVEQGVVHSDHDHAEVREAT